MSEWRHDALVQPLPPGTFAIARRLVAEYRMADPAIVRASWDPAAALAGREMRLQLRLWRVLHVYARVRVTRVWDEERRFGFEYETLPGHLEIGRMDYEVAEAQSGAVEFRLHATSKPSGKGAWWARIGFRLFGRREQLRFYHRCCTRMARLTAREAGLPETQPAPTVRLDQAR